MPRQGLPRLAARKPCARATLLQLGPLRAIAHQHQLQARVHGPHGLEGIDQQAQVFLGGQPPHRQHHPVVLAHAPLRTQAGIAVGGVEHGRVNATRHHMQALKALAIQRAAQLLGGHHRAVGLVVELAQVGGNGLLQPAHAVVAAVGIEVGSEITAYRQPQLACRLQSRPAQRPFGGDVNQVGPPRRPQRQQMLFGRQPHAQVRVFGNGQTAHQHLLQPVDGPLALGIRGLARAQKLHIVPPGLQTRHQTSQRHGHAVDFGRVGFGHQGHPQ